MKIGLRICVNSLRGAEQGVPNLLRLLDEYKLHASFFFALGPDKSGRWQGRRALQPWRSQLNLKSRLYGTLLLPPDITRRAADTLRAVANAGHEVGLLAYDWHGWVTNAAFADETWTEDQLTRAVERFETVFHKRPKAFAAAAWQVNPNLLKLEQELGFDYASDVRGKSIFFPVLQDVESRCPQIPTTLPTLDDLLKRGGEISADNVHEYLYAESQYILPHGHVYALNAEMEGMAYLPLMEKLVVMWKGYGEGLTSLGALYEGVDRMNLSRHQIGWSEQASLDYHVATQAIRL
jgi:undecaprenyl phosphate-alpha-L-ara4FN deformylase